MHVSDCEKGFGHSRSLFRKQTVVDAKVASSGSSAVMESKDAKDGKVDTRVEMTELVSSPLSAVH